MSGCSAVSEMRVLLTVAEMGPGGAERMLAELARALRQGGHPVAVAAESGPFDSLLDGSGVDRQALPGRGRSPLRVAIATVRLRGVIGAFAPDVIHAHNVKATGVAAVARRVARARASPLVATFHGVQRDEYRSAARILRMADAVVCVSEDLAQGLSRHGLPDERIRLIRNAVPLPEPLTSAPRRALNLELGLDDRPVVSMVGRLVPQKAPVRFVEAMAQVAQAIPDCRFLVVGDGPLRGRVEAEARRLGLEERVAFTGVREDARALIARSDLIVFSSEWEGMPVVALEALAAGTPVVATDVEGMRELLGTGAGLLTPRHAPSIAEAVVDLLRDPERRAEMGGIGRHKIAAEFSVESMVRSYQELYRELARE
jgi:glycosyltransferase involved in cell wall biosynthesis